jgi:uncharacterized membrane protein YgcG
MRAFRLLLMAFAVAFAAASSVLADRPPQSELSDAAAMLSADDAVRVREAIGRASVSGQVLVVISPNLGGKTAEQVRAEYAAACGAEGIAIGVFRDDRLVVTAAGAALGRIVTSAAMSGIEENVIRDSFRRGDFAGGLISAVDMLSKLRVDRVPVAPAVAAPVRSAFRTSAFAVPGALMAGGAVMLLLSMVFLSASPSRGARFPFGAAPASSAMRLCPFWLRLPGGSAAWKPPSRELLTEAVSSAGQPSQQSV